MPVRTLHRRQTVHQLEDLLERALADQRPDGAVVEPEWGLPAPMRAAQLLVAVALLAPVAPVEQHRRHRAALAALGWLDGARRPSGRHDLPTTNPDSAPDTAFVMQLLALAVEAIRRRERTDLADVERGLLDHMRTSVPGMVTGGFHTPNHRWVISSALAMARTLLGPDDRAEAVLADYLAEGLDIDDDGAGIDRSAGAYDAVNDRAVLLLAQHGALGQDAALRAVRANLDLDRALLNADATIEVAASSRQDKDTVTVPDELAAVMVWAGALAGDDELTGLGAWVYGQAEPTDNGVVWMSIVLDMLGLETVRPSAPRDEIRSIPRSGMWRRRSGSLTTTVLTSSPHVVSVRNGQVSVTAVGLHHTYFGPLTGTFHPDHHEVRDDGVMLRSSGERDPRRPGYDLPLGRPVGPEAWERVRDERGLVLLPPMATTIQVRTDPSQVSLDIRTEDGLEAIPCVIVLDLPAAGVWRTADLELRPVAGQTLMLRRSFLEVTVGSDTVRIGPGADAHTMWQPRNLPARPGLVRVLVPLMTPVEHTLTLTADDGRAAS